MGDARARLAIKHVELSEANAFVGQHHRHHDPDVGHRFSLGVYDGERLCGVAIVGRPKAKSYDQRMCLEVTRLATDGTPNACSALYGAAVRAGRALGYARIQTYILESEPGTSLKAAGWMCEGEAGGGTWNHTGFNGGTLFTLHNRTQPTCKKLRWALALA